MNLPLPAVNRHSGGPFRRLALAVLALAVLIGASAPTPASGFLPAAQPLSVALSGADSPVAANAEGLPSWAGASCWVYPFSFHAQVLDENSTTGKPAPEPMPDPSAPINEIPQASRFQVNFSLQQGKFLNWTGNQSLPAFQASFTDGGTLGAGFVEATPPASDPAAQRLINATLEQGDWSPFVTAPITGLAAPLDDHIIRRTIMILPVHNAIAGSGANGIVRVQRFVRVRLLEYNFVSGGGYLGLGLVRDDTPYACFQHTRSVLVGEATAVMPRMPQAGTQIRSWDFGDGSPASAALTPTHAYAQPGAYTVTLTLPHTPTLRAVGRIEVIRPALPPRVFLPAALRRSAP